MTSLLPMIYSLITTWQIIATGKIISRARSPLGWVKNREGMMVFTLSPQRTSFNLEWTLAPPHWPAPTPVMWKKKSQRVMKRLWSWVNNFLKVNLPRYMVTCSSMLWFVHLILNLKLTWLWTSVRWKRVWSWNHEIESKIVPKGRVHDRPD